MNKDTNLREISGVGEKTAALFAKKGLYTIGDLLRYYPRDYEFYESPVTVEEAAESFMKTDPEVSQAVCTEKKIALVLTTAGSARTASTAAGKITNIQAGDETGKIRLTYYNMPYMARNIPAGSIHVFRGVIRRYKNGSLQMEQASVFSPDEYESLSRTLVPLYPLAQGLTQKMVRRTVRKALEYLDPKMYPADLHPDCRGEQDRRADYIPEEDRRRLCLMEESEASYSIHFPSGAEQLEEARSRKVFDEFFSFLLTVRKEKAKNAQRISVRPMHRVDETQELIIHLPFSLTDGQRQAWSEIEQDLCGPYVMNRLLQGDVGSGKTILAFLALLLTACNGRQGAMMAPTEVLARQHMKSLQSLIEAHSLPLHPVLLTGSVRGKERTSALRRISSGECDVVIGTHALIQDAVVYHDLSMVITDEQHRFGVRQRENFSHKGDFGDAPDDPACRMDQTHILVMSATPIPRTLAIILYGDLQVSLLRERPQDRLPIRNLAAPACDRGKIYRFILDEIAKGRQAYVICPAVEESMLDGLQNVRDYTAMIRASLPAHVRVDSLNGRMKPEEKNRVMERFLAGEADILVSTTVIEVGINVPNATVMLVENAERFGLSQLHQLRGRVGRGRWQSYCIFLYSEQLENKPERLKILEQTNDGFTVAEQDLRMRGPGDVFGTRQSGELGFVLGDIYEDAGILTSASAYADEVLAKCPGFHLEDAAVMDPRTL